MKRLLLVFILILTPFAIFADITISDDTEITVKGFYEGTSGYILKIWSDAATNTTIYNNLKTKITTGSDYFPTALEVPSSGILTVDELRTGVQTGIFVWYFPFPRFRHMSETSIMSPAIKSRCIGQS